MFTLKQRNLILLVALLTVFLFLFAGEAGAAELVNENAYELRFDQVAKTDNGEYVYELMIRQSKKASDRSDDYGLSMATLKFNVGGLGLSSLAVSIADGGNTNFRCKSDGTSFTVYEQKPDNALWLEPAEGFTYLCTVVTNVSVTFRLDTDPKTGSAITNGGSNDSADITLLPSGLGNLGFLVGGGGGDKIILDVPTFFDGWLITAGYDSMGRMLGPVVVQETADMKTLPSDWEITDRAEASVTNIELSYNLDLLAEIRIFLVSDLTTMEILSPKAIIKYDAQ